MRIKKKKNAVHNGISHTDTTSIDPVSNHQETTWVETGPASFHRMMYGTYISRKNVRDMKNEEKGNINPGKRSIRTYGNGKKRTS